MSGSTETLVLQLKALGDTPRMRLLALCRRGECSVSELTRITGQSQPRVSQQLKQLCEAGFLERFRDGRQVYYRVPTRGTGITLRRQLLDLIPESEDVFRRDAERLLQYRSERIASQPAGAGDSASDRAIHSAFVELTVTAPIGALLDIGCGRASLLKLLASRAQRAVGVDIDSRARQFARAELMLAGVPNCSLRKGDMYQLPFDDAEFNTIIMDDVLGDAHDPLRALVEARRLLKPGGRIFVLLSTSGRLPGTLQRSLAGWSTGAGLRLAPGRLIPRSAAKWLLAVATPAETTIERATAAA